MDAAPIPVETLLAHREWVRAVARAVVRDPNAADDVEQDAWVAALTSPPRHESSLRGWFGAVVRSRARRTGRTDARRGRRETVAARADIDASAADLAEIADTHRRVVQAVVELAEPYRQTILLRYFEGLAVEDVAARTAVPLNTARARISRGLAQLRERLARELGEDERPWELALAPLIGGKRTSLIGATVAGGAVMASTTKAGVAIVAVVLVLAGIVMVATSNPARSPGGADAGAIGPEASARSAPSRRRSPVVPASSAVGEHPSPLRPGDDADSAAESGDDAPSKPAEAPLPPAVVYGRVLDASGATVPDATIVQVADGLAIATTDASGHYEAQLDRTVALKARSKWHSESRAIGFRAMDGERTMIDFTLGASAGAISARVSSEQRAVAGVTVTAWAESPKADSIGDGLQRWSAVTDARGEATLECVTPGRKTIAVIRAVGFEDAKSEVVVEGGQRSAVELRLTRKPRAERLLETTRTSFNFQSAPLADAVMFIDEVQQDVRVLIDPTVADALKSRAVTCAVNDLPLGEALRVLCHAIGGVTYVVQDEVVWIIAEKR